MHSNLCELLYMVRGRRAPHDHTPQTTSENFRNVIIEIIGISISQGVFLLSKYLLV